MKEDRRRKKEERKEKKSDSDTQLPDKAGKAMERIARGKHEKYQQYAADNGSKFVPLAMDNHC